MIESFRHKGLRELYETGSSAKLAASLQERIKVRLMALDSARSIEELNQPGFNFHSLRGTPRRYSIHVNGPWCLTFEWSQGKAARLDLEQYH
jgi:toxin HigB-1